MQRMALFIVFLFFFSSMSAFSVNATSEDLVEFAENTHTEPILIEGLPPLMCGEDLCERPIRTNLRTTQPASEANDCLLYTSPSPRDRG